MNFENPPNPMNSELLHLILWRAVIELCRRCFQLFDLYYPFRVIFIDIYTGLKILSIGTITW